MNQQEDDVDNQAQIARVLHYVIGSGHCRPGLVVNSSIPDPTGVVELRVHYSISDLHDDIEVDRSIQGVLPDHKIKTRFTWHWPRECSHMKEETNE